jgi:hypothetical protein
MPLLLPAVPGHCGSAVVPAGVAPRSAGGRRGPAGATCSPLPELCHDRLPAIRQVSVRPLAATLKNPDEPWFVCVCVSQSFLLAPCVYSGRGGPDYTLVIHS